MQITNSAYLAVECMARLTGCTIERPGKTLWLAQGIERSVSYTEALMARLRRAGLVKAKKGSGGGYVLSRSPESITIADIFGAFDEPRAAPACPSMRIAKSTSNGSGDTGGTELLWETLRNTVLVFLDRVSLADVAAAEARDGRDHSMRFSRFVEDDLRERSHP